jgi:hypothetical protein
MGKILLIEFSVPPSTPLSGLAILLMAVCSRGRREAEGLLLPSLCTELRTGEWAFEFLRGPGA